MPCPVRAYIPGTVVLYLRDILPYMRKAITVSISK